MSDPPATREYEQFRVAFIPPAAGTYEDGLRFAYTLADAMRDELEAERAEWERMLRLALSHIRPECLDKHIADLRARASLAVQG